MNKFYMYSYNFIFPEARTDQVIEENESNTTFPICSLFITVVKNGRRAAFTRRIFRIVPQRGGEMHPNNKILHSRIRRFPQIWIIYKCHVAYTTMYRSEKLNFTSYDDDEGPPRVCIKRNVWVKRFVIHQSKVVRIM